MASLKEMKCPDCLLRIHKSAEECPHCGLSLCDLRELFNEANPVVDDGVQDVAGVLRKRMRESLLHAHKKCQKQFANLHIAMCFVALKQDVKIESYGFWMLNDGVFRKDAVELHNLGGRVVIVIDMTKKMVTMNVGYMLEEYVTENECFDVLADGHASLLEGDLVRGGEEIFASLRKYLRKVYRRANKGKKVVK